MAQKWGQHFLRQVPKELFAQIDQHLRRVEQGRAESKEKVQKLPSTLRVLEIGPGPGAVTRMVIHNLQSVISKGQVDLTLVEIDPQFIPSLTQLIAPLSFDNRVSLVNTDFLQFNLTGYLVATPGDTPVFIIGSLPYESSKKIISHIVKSWQESCSTRGKSGLTSVNCSFINQKEVSDAYAAQPPHATFLSNWLQLFATEIRAVRTIKPGEFSPPPKVDSNILQFVLPGARMTKNGMRSESITSYEYRNDELGNYEVSNDSVDRFVVFLRQMFQQQRKTINNRLKQLTKGKGKGTGIAIAPERLDAAILTYPHLLQRRPSELLLTEWLQLYRWLGAPPSEEG